jgi:TP901 family phage tail tape measure protein
VAGAEGIRAGRAYVELGVNSAPLTSGLRKVQMQVKAFGQSLTHVGAVVAKAGLAAGIPLAVAAHSFSDFESAMARVRAVLGDVTEKDLAGLEAEARKMGLETAYSARQAAEGMIEFAIAGFKAKDVVKAIHPTLDLAAAGMIEVKEAAKISARVINDMGYSADHLRSVLDVIGKAATSGGTSITDLGEAFKFVGPIARVAGVQLTEVVAAIQLLGKSGIEGEMAGTTLRGMILSLTSPGADAKATLKELKVEVNDAAGNFRGLVAIIADLEKALSGMGTGTVLEKLGMIFPARAAAGVAALVSKGAGPLAKQKGVLDSAGGSTAKIAEIQLNTLRGAWMLLTSSLEGLGIVVGKAVAPFLRQLGELLMFVTNAVAAWSEKNPGLFRTISQVSVGLMAAGAAIAALGLSVQLGAAAFGGLLAVLGMVGVAVKLWLNPTFVALRWVATALYLIPGAADAGRGAWAKLADAGRAAFASISNVVKLMWSDTKTAFDGIRDAMAMGDAEGAMEIAWLGIKAVWAQGVSYLTGAWDDFTGYLGDRMRDALAGLQVMWIEATSFIFGDTDKWGEAFSGVWTQLADAVKLYWDVTVGSVLRLIDEVKAALKQAGDLAAPLVAAAALLNPAGALALASTGGALAQLPGVRGLSQDEAAQRRRRLDEVAEAREVADAQATADAIERADARRADVDAKRKALEDAVAAAKEKRDYEEFLAAESKMPGDVGLGDKQLPDVGRSLSAGKFETAGTFGSFGVGQSLAFGKSLAEQQLDAAKETAKNTKRIADEGGGVKVI